MKRNVTTFDDLARMTAKGFSDMQNHMDHRFKQVNEKFEDVDKQLEHIDKQLVSMDKKIDRLENYAISHERRISTLEDKVTFLSLKAGLRHKN